jgi:hypothetical protein
MEKTIKSVFICHKCNSELELEIGGTVYGKEYDPESIGCRTTKRKIVIAKCKKCGYRDEDYFK